MSNEIHRIEFIDGLRAVSITIVLVEHLSYQYREHLPASFLKSFLGNGRLGVIIFFVVSGYLITKLLLRELTKTKRLAWYNFIARRAIRLYPVLYSYLVVIVCLNVGGVIANSYMEFGFASMFLWNYLPPSCKSPDYWYMGHFWSLALEQQFYLFWPVALTQFRKEVAGLSLLVLIPLMPVARVITYYAWPPQRGMIAMMFHTASDAVLIGCAFGIYEDRVTAFAVRFKKFFVISTAALVVMAVLVSPLGLFWFRGAYLLPIGMTVDALAACGVLACLTVWPASRLATFLSLRPIAHVGMISYSVYVWQQLFLGPSFLRTHLGIAEALLLMFACAEVSYWGIERPILSRGKAALRDLSSKRARDAGPEVALPR